MYKFGATFRSGFAEHVLAMIGDCVFADGQAARYLLRAEACSDMGEDFFFALREVD